MEKASDIDTRSGQKECPSTLLIFSKKLFSYLQAAKLEEGTVSKLRDWHQAPHPQHAFWDNTGTRWGIPGHETVDMNLEERQVSEQMCNFINIALEDIPMSKTYWFVKPLWVLSLRWNRLEETQSLG